MSAQRQAQEIVRVIKPFRLIDAESYERAYWRRDGQALAVGFYVVAWPNLARAGVFNEDARFRGPYADRQAAVDAAHQATQRRVRTAMVSEAPPAESMRLGAGLAEVPTRIPERWRVKT